MKIAICAVGRLRKGPEKDLIDDYLLRFTRSGRPLGLDAVNLIEVEDRKNAGMKAEAQLLDKACPQGFIRVALDERGRTPDSPEFAGLIGNWRDAGRPGVAFLIGGADGLDPALRDGCDMSISFGRMVWPHMLVRVMLSEQIYRAASILAGSPYHRA